ncbi:hypothetical protein TRIUR3_03510 [Triticum urartu]|uniref:Thaumatin-like protein n=1 Tax=Triticum urartu TaxID=4572 RepID=M7ZUT5_TRIUA|nr:hypothetical protein TRIUR3_03510 [Triticum urartu]
MASMPVVSFDGERGGLPPPELQPQAIAIACVESMTSARGTSVPLAKSQPCLSQNHNRASRGSKTVTLGGMGMLIEDYDGKLPQSNKAAGQPVEADQVEEEEAGQAEALRHPASALHSASALLKMLLCGDEVTDCAGALSCRVSGEQPATLAEYTLGQGGSQDFFDLSVIDGFNTPMSFQPVGGAPCRAATCAVDITRECLPELQVPGGCASACGKFGGDTYCCRGQFEHNCPPTVNSRFFKAKCPDAYSYAKDDQTSTFTCPAGTNYQIVLCPARNDLHMDQ